MRYFKKDKEDKEEKYSDESYLKLLNKSRHILLFDVISNISAYYVIGKMRAFNLQDKKKPIILEICSPGGDVSAGMAIINAMKSISSPVITVINGEACSMAAFISIVGDKRYIYENSYWMEHPCSDVVGDYIQYIKDRTRFLTELEGKMEGLLRKYTKLTQADFDKIKTGELWLNSQECLEKGVVDEIFKFKS